MQAGAVAYLDYAGAPICHPDLVNTVSDDLKKLLLGNPHSRNSSSQTTSDLIDQCRFRILHHFHTNPETYSIVFTQSCTSALKLLAECFDFSICSHCSITRKTQPFKVQETFVPTSDECLTNGPSFIYLQDNHTSVVGMREYAVKKQVNVYCIDDTDVENRLTNCEPSNETCQCKRLFVFPAQSNFCGRKYPMQWVKQIKERNKTQKSCCFICLDAASLVGTSDLDLSAYQPDFVTLSFYKMFGYPSGLGALVIKNDSAEVLKKVYFGGGVVSNYLPRRNVHTFRTSLSDRFEDGTLPYQQIIALLHGFRFWEKLGGLQEISEKTYRLAKSTYMCLSRMTHSNENPVVRLYTHDDFKNPASQGPIINFNLLKPDGSYVGYTEVEKMAELYNVQLRTGCFCNQGACQKYLHLLDEALMENFKAGKECGDVIDIIDNQPLGSVRISFGFLSTDQDAKHFLKMIFDCFITRTENQTFESLGKQFDQFAKEMVANLNTVNISNNKLVKSNYMQNLRGRSLGSINQYKQSAVCLTDIFIYPLKSCGGFTCEKWPICKTGLIYDRHWMVVNDNGLCLNQKRIPQLALIKAKVSIEKNILTLKSKGYDALVVNFDNSRFPIENETNYLTTSPFCESKICADRVASDDAGEDAADWVSLVLNISYCRVVSQSEHLPRFSQSSKRAQGENHQSLVSFSNVEQYLLINRSSVRRLLALINQTNPEITEDDLISRFRPNLVVDGAVPFEEDTWKSVTIGSVKFTCVGKCMRCQMICINQETAEIQPEVLVSLRDIKENKITFGIYLKAEDEYDGSELSVGNTVIFE